MIKSFISFNFFLIFLGYFFQKNSIMVLLLFLEIFVLTYIFTLLSMGVEILSIFNLSINFMVFSVIAATLGLTLLSFIFKNEESSLMKSSLL